MAIRASSAKQIDALISDLTGSSGVAREAAVARLTVIGARAVDRLIDLVASHSDAAVRSAALRALEGVGDDRSLTVALRAAGDAESAVACAAIAVARRFLRGIKSAAIVDRLTAIALDTARPDVVRESAVGALRDLEPKTIAPLLKKLAADLNANVRAAAQARPAAPDRSAAESPSSREAPAGVRDWLVREGVKAPLSSLLGIVERVRVREASEPPPRRAVWTAIRFAAHLVLARRKSRVALYDLRESVAAARTPLPADGLTALTLIGDASCLEAIASAHARSQDSEWRDQLLQLFHAIARREKLTSRHAVMKKIEKKWNLR